MDGDGYVVRISEDRFRLPSERLDDLRERLVRTRLPPDLGGGWERGVPGDWLRAPLASTGSLHGTTGALRSWWHRYFAAHGVRVAPSVECRDGLRFAHR